MNVPYLLNELNIYQFTWNVSLVASLRIDSYRPQIKTHQLDQVFMYIRIYDLFLTQANLKCICY